jgi:serine/threonine protein kinase
VLMPAGRVTSEADIQAALGPFDELVPIGGPSGSGEAWRARSGQDVFAVKVVVHEHEPGRFEREVAALKLIDSARVMRILRDGHLTVGGTTYPYIVSEFVEGQNARGQLAAGAPNDDDLRSFLVELLRGLEEIKAAGIVHRDLKPENVILRGGDWAQPVVIDLGLSRLIDASSMTVYPWAYGTWQYMAPEQLRGERAIHQSDMWAVAVIAGELATGQHPFHRPGETPLPADWDARLRAGVIVPGSRPAALRDMVAAVGDYRAYRRTDARRTREAIEAAWV